MMEKQNRQVTKDAAGDSGALDDLVDFAAGKMEAAPTEGLSRQSLKDRRRRRAELAEDASPVVG